MLKLAAAITPPNTLCLALPSPALRARGIGAAARLEY